VIRPDVSSPGHQWPIEPLFGMRLHLDEETFVGVARMSRKCQEQSFCAGAAAP
jgi:hypothetical protein